MGDLIKEITVTDYINLVAFVISAVGMWKIFAKCGRRKWMACIPVFRNYEMGVCARRELEGRVLIWLYALNLVLNLAIRNEGGVPGEIMTNASRMGNLLEVFSLAVTIATLIYTIRVYTGLCNVFGRKRGWVWGFAFLESVFLLIWGVDKSFVPVVETEDEDELQGASESGHVAATIKDGLTVNIRERTAKVAYKTRRLLKDIHLSIPKGHMVLLLGGSGAGKTTFLNAVTGYEKADAKIELLGDNLYDEYESLKYDVGFVPQQDLMRTNDTVGLTLSDAAALRLPGNVKAADRRKRVHDVLEQFGLLSLSHTLVEKLSGGQRKRLSIAMEFISDPTLFILDEPDSGLDGVVARNLFESLRKIADEGKIVIVITHTPDRVIDLFDDVIVLAKDVDRTGRLAFFGPVEEAYTFFDKKSMEQILLTINQKDEGGEGRAGEFVERYGKELERKEGSL